MERLLQYVWKYRFYDEAGMCTAEGLPVTVIDPGIQNPDAGPDFFNAKIRIAGTVWAGCVEIHRKASEWHTHHHDRDPAYDSVILHVVEEDDTPVRRTNGETIRQAVIRVPPRVREHMEWLLAHDTQSPCLERISEVESIHMSAWLNALVGERLERKTAAVLTLQERYEDWNEVFYITLMRNFGFGTNSDAFEWLAESLPFHCIRKHRDNRLSIEALLFGQAGLLAGTYNDPYCRLLQREYAFLQTKYRLKPVEGFLFRKLRIRPVNFPHIRLAQLAAIWSTNDTLFSEVLENSRPEILNDRFNIPVSDYWETHYHFDAVSPSRKKPVGANTVHVILINTVAPVLFAYGKKKQQPEYTTRALQLLEDLPPERNSLVKTFTRAGIRVKSAADTQALIQLRREYCEKKKCLYCRIAYHLIRKGSPVKSCVPATANDK
ncbi:MAG: DUF2851 family protein [Tannerella sp.]|jgi:hypothetical protein|nr:DUF2851 family protein [Tannerella sp.]